MARVAPAARRAALRNPRPRRALTIVAFRESGEFVYIPTDYYKVGGGSSTASPAQRAFPDR